MPTLDDLPEAMTAKQLAAYLQTSPQSLSQDRYLRRGIPYVKFGGRVRYMRADVAAYLAANRQAGAA